MVVLFIINIKQHIFWDKQPLLTIFALYYKSLMYVAIAFSLANYMGKDIIMLVFIISCTLYMIISAFIKPRGNEILIAYIYILVSTSFQSYSFLVQ
ncbi:MAG: hypothetical protein LBM25_04050 [Bacteroidales bacterium]|jgi:hypothetical protein|nr:hypothetical protein [Bacteroidales bacterium]